MNDAIEPKAGDLKDAAFSIVNGKATAPILIICDHASRHLPPEFGNMGLDDEHLTRHIAWDIGAADVARRLAELLDAPAVLCGTSRLVIDCNRPLDAESSIPLYSDDVSIPGNAKVDAVERQRRIDRYFHPYHDEIERRLHAHLQQGRRPAMISVHSFTPEMDGFLRPWHVGLLWHEDERLSAPIVEHLLGNPDLVVGENEPYNGSDPPGYALHTHAADNDLPIALFEIRQDLVETPAGIQEWAEILHGALQPALASYFASL